MAFFSFIKNNNNNYVKWKKIRTKTIYYRTRLDELDNNLLVSEPIKPFL